MAARTARRPLPARAPQRLTPSGRRRDATCSCSPRWARPSAGGWRPSGATRDAAPEPAPTPVATGRATVIDVADPLGDAEAAEAWLRGAGRGRARRRRCAMLNRALHAFRAGHRRPLPAPGRPPAGDRRPARLRRRRAGRRRPVDGRARADRRRRRPAASRSRVAARRRPGWPRCSAAASAALACEELALRARLDLDHDRAREAALQLLVALDAALAELAADPAAAALASGWPSCAASARRSPAPPRRRSPGPLDRPEREARRFARRTAGGRAARPGRRQRLTGCGGSPAAAARDPAQRQAERGERPPRARARRRRRSGSPPGRRTASRPWVTIAISPPAASVTRGQLRHRIDLQRGADAQQQVGAGGQLLGARAARRPAGTRRTGRRRA